jgi:hypothetical protein
MTFCCVKRTGTLALLGSALATHKGSTARYGINIERVLDQFSQSNSCFVMLVIVSGCAMVDCCTAAARSNATQHWSLGFRLHFNKEDPRELINQLIHWCILPKFGLENQENLIDA